MREYSSSSSPIPGPVPAGANRVARLTSQSQWDDIAVGQGTRANTAVYARGRRVFSASISAESGDMWSKYRLAEGELVPRVVQRLESSDQ